MKVAEPVKLQKYAKSEETKMVSPEVKYVLVVARFRVQYAKYFTSF